MNDVEALRILLQHEFGGAEPWVSLELDPPLDPEQGVWWLTIDRAAGHGGRRHVEQVDQPVSALVKG